MSGVEQNIGDEPPVVGEPASQPHQAAVVGEPPEDMGPVLGEPVPFANGLQQDKEPVSSSSPDESAINGIYKETSPASSDAPSSTPSNVESANPAMATAADEQIMTEEASAEEGIRSASENPIQPESTSETSEARAEEVPHASDSAEVTDVANSAADTAEDAEVTHMTDAPSRPPLPESLTSTENPFSVLDEDSVETDLKVSDEGEEPVVTDVPNEVHEETVSQAQDEESTKSSGPSYVESVEGNAVVPHVHEETRGSSASAADSQEEATPTAAREEPTDVEHKNVHDGVSEETSLSEPPKAKEAIVAEPQESASHAEAAEDEKVHEVEKLEEKPAEPGFTLSEGKLVNGREVVLPEGKRTPTKEAEGIDASPGEAEQVVNREAALPEADKIPSKEGEKQASPDSSLPHIEKNVTADAFPMESSGLRTIAAEAGNVDQPPSDETLLGENGFQHGEDDAPREKQQGLSKDEKPSSRFKLPMVFTTLAVAVVGVAVASFSRSRQ